MCGRRRTCPALVLRSVQRKRRDRGGVALIAAAVIWMLRWPRLSVSWQTGVLLVTAVASLVGIFMNVNFHLANGGTHPWLIPPSGFDEGLISTA
jgi:hypothetical protein